MNLGYLSDRQAALPPELQQQHQPIWSSSGEITSNVLVEEGLQSEPEDAGCQGACSGLQAVCYERKTKRDLGWIYVGEGKGSYKQVEEFNYVGKGVGNYELESSDWPRLLCLGVFMAVSGLIALVVIWLVVCRGPLSHHPAKGIPSYSLLQEPHDFKCSPQLRSDVAGWSLEHREYCCRNFALACRDGGAEGNELLLLTAADCVSSTSSWSFDKKAWCCANTGQGCGDEK
mmetsp:Transcript_23518/g.51584  ORF Transcript_23518/g.51584 Transcript_23518/m.51584 type:complete len:230 (-) Transcript_23518:52-741(-)